MFKTCDWSNERVHSISELIHQKLKICVCVVKHYRTLVLALLLTRVITKKSYEMDCASWGKRADCIQVSAGFVIHIFRRPMFLWIFFKIIDWIAIAHSNCSLQRFTNAAQRCIKAVYQPYGYFFACLRKRSCSSQCRYRSSHKNGLLQQTENSVRATFLQHSLQR